MTLPVEAILFDMGGTLRTTVRRGDEAKQQKVGQILKLLGSDLPLVEFTQLLTNRSKAYKKWAEETEVELNEVDLWSRWMLPDFPVEQVTSLAVQLNQVWRDAVSQYVVLPNAKEVLLTLFRRGYRLGLISNTTSSMEVPQTFEDLEISGLFEVVILSCVIGKRKPDPEILLSATSRMRIEPERCAYIGDIPRRDVKASRGAGFASSIIISDTLTLENMSGEPSLKPDHIIRDLRELLTLFPPRQELLVHPGGNGKTAGIPPLFDVSLSTMWALRNFPGLEDFFEMAKRFGFANLELNHQVDSAMLAGIDLSRYQFSSVHEPCPADISMDTLKTRDWSISATDEEKRKQGVVSIKHSLDLADTLRVKALVVHSGNVRADWPLENQMYQLFKAGGGGSPEFLELKNHLVNERAALAAPRMEAVQKSLQELLEYAQPLGVRLGLENRYHYMDIPIPDEMELLLSLADPERLGFWYDIGHAQTLDRLGFFLHQEWLDRFASRIVGIHFHDAVGINDHGAPGTGEVDFDRIARYLPDNAIHTLELKPGTTPEQLRDSLQFLAQKGCIQYL